MRSFVLVALIVGAVAVSCSTATPCSGCFDAQGRCLSGTEQQACGTAGSHCANCTLLHSSCVVGACVLSPDGGGSGSTGGGGATGGGGGATGGGGGSTCQGCVDSMGACQAGTAASACGADGGLCANCTSIGATCSAARACVEQRYPDGGSRSRFWDGGTCAVKTDCPCFSSDDCGPGFTCHSEDNTGVHVYCVPGARGAGVAGAPCTGEGDCESALCVDSASSGQKCSALCDVAGECPVILPKCTYVGFGIERSLCSP